MNKQSEITHYRTNVIKKYVTEVMNKLECEEKRPKRLCARCRTYQPLENFYQYQQTYSLYCKRCLHETSKKTKK